MQCLQHAMFAVFSQVDQTPAGAVSHWHYYWSLLLISCYESRVMSRNPLEREGYHPLAGAGRAAYHGTHPTLHT
jgi:hypothetical protein